MTRFYGKVGYGETVETSPGVHEDTILEIDYYGDILRVSRSLEQREDLNQAVTVENRISILADAYAMRYFTAIRYVEWAGVRFTVTNVEVERPRLILSLGEVYNGPVPA